MPQLPRHLQELKREGITVQQLNEVRDVLAKRGITVAYVQRKGWVASCLGFPKQEGFHTSVPHHRLNLGLGTLVEYLRKPETLVDAFFQQGADTSPRET